MQQEVRHKLSKEACPCFGNQGNMNYQGMMSGQNMPPPPPGYGVCHGPTTWWNCGTRSGWKIARWLQWMWLWTAAHDFVWSEFGCSGGYACVAGVSQPRPPISMLLTAGFRSSRKTMFLKLNKSSLKLGGGGRVCPRSWFRFIHLCAASYFCEYLKAGNGVWIHQGFGRLIRRPLQ